MLTTWLWREICGVVKWCASEGEATSWPISSSCSWIDLQIYGRNTAWMGFMKFICCGDVMETSYVLGYHHVQHQILVVGGLCEIEKVHAHWYQTCPQSAETQQCCGVKWKLCWTWSIVTSLWCYLFCVSQYEIIDVHVLYFIVVCGNVVKNWVVICWSGNSVLHR